MRTISLKHLKKNLLSGNYDKYHLPLFLRKLKHKLYVIRFKIRFFLEIRSVLFVVAVPPFHSLFHTSPISISSSLSSAAFSPYFCFYYICGPLFLRWVHTSNGIKMQQQRHRLNEAKGFLFGDQVTYLTVIKNILYICIYLYIHNIFTTGWQFFGSTLFLFSLCSLSLSLFPVHDHHLLGLQHLIYS